jgi:hypothetical protein
MSIIDVLIFKYIKNIPNNFQNMKVYANFLRAICFNLIF